MIIKESLLRDLTNLELKKLKLGGDVLDIGGGKNTRYGNIFLNHINLEHINISSNKNPTYLHDLNYSLELDKKYDFILCIHTIEHIKKFENIFNYAKFLKKNASMIIIAPFLYRIHGDPFDFVRLSKDYYKSYFDDNTYEVKVKSLGYGVFSSSFSLIEPIFQRFGLRLIGFLLRNFFIGLDRLFCFISRDFSKYYGKDSYPLGYLVKISLK